MNETNKFPMNPENPARPPVRYRVPVAPGTFEERLSRSGLDIGHRWAMGHPVDRAIAGDFWMYVLRYPTEFETTHMAKVIRSFNLEPAGIEHLLAFAEAFPNEPAHYPLMALGTSQVVPFPGDWNLLVFPVVMGKGKIGGIGVDYKDYNKYGDQWIEEDVSLLCLSRMGASNSSERSEAPFKYPPPSRQK